MANRKSLQNIEATEVINFLTSNFNLYRIPKKIKSDRGGAFISKEYKQFCKDRKIEIEYCEYIEYIPETE